MSNAIDFTFSDLVAGYVQSFDEDADTFVLRTSDGRDYTVGLSDTTFAEMLRNLSEAYVDATGQLRDLLGPGRFLFAYGVHYPEAGAYTFEAKHIVLQGATETEFAFERPDWWITQVRALGDFYLRAEFGDGPVDFRNYRTSLGLSGERAESFRQETDTISRLVFGFATAYLMTGEDRFLEAADKGTTYLRDHMRSADVGTDVVYWAHGIDVAGSGERKILASEFGDDYNAIPAYEQIYALAGPTQTYRVTGDPKIWYDIESTVRLFDRYYADPVQGGYFSHLDPVTLDPRSETLGHNRARKNWNSVGDHAPAYLINAYLASGDPTLLEFLARTADTIVERFPDYENSPFVNEKFHEDWTPDHHWNWQQNRAVVGHNLKIAWNLIRVQNVHPDDRYVALAEKIAEIMPTVGADLQRGGWYDVMERTKGAGQEHHRFVWHDRKAWWQQEQAILAYLVLTGTGGKAEHAKLARESTAFYSTWFLDQDSGGVYFNVQANGLPYLLGTERLKGSHSMSGYHSFELAYLAAVYTNLLVTKQPLDLHFKPMLGAFPDNVLRVSPDILPVGSVMIQAVWVNEAPYTAFDAEALTVTLPPERGVTVRVRLAPTGDDFDVQVTIDGAQADVTVVGRLEDGNVRRFERALEHLVAENVTTVRIDASGVTGATTAAVRALLMLRQRLGLGSESDVVLTGLSPELRTAVEAVAPDHGGLRLE
ncbi:MAG: STAS domain-containing protein [Cellulomonadaceae bacterium]|nr:STAS domain-containing protein [Cellulomonadaceae bacterium]